MVGPGNSKFCSADCRENAQKSSERFADMTRRDEEALRAARQATFSKMIVALLILIALAVALYVAWPKLPHTVTDPVVNVLKSIRSIKLY